MNNPTLTALAATLLAVSSVGQTPSWTQVTTANSPDARRDHQMVYDSVRGKVVMFGGVINASSTLDDTWEYDGVDWTQVTTATIPGNRYYHQMVYDLSLIHI